VIQIGRVNKELLPVVHKDVAKIIVDTMPSWLQEVELGDIFRHIHEGKWDLWLGTDDHKVELVLICMWESHAKVQHYHLYQMGGVNLAKYIEEGLAKVEEYAGKSGAKSVVADAGRKEWITILKAKDYVPFSIELRKDVAAIYAH
jgi:hypothetical protein